MSEAALQERLSRMPLEDLHYEIAHNQASIANASISSVRRHLVSRNQVLQTELDRRIIQQHDARDRRYTVNLTLANLSWSERDLVNSIVALLSDPALDEQRRKVVEGEVAIAIEGGEVTWVSTSELEAA